VYLLLKEYQLQMILVIKLTLLTHLHSDQTQLSYYRHKTSVTLSDPLLDSVQHSYESHPSQIEDITSNYRKS